MPTRTLHTHASMGGIMSAMIASSLPTPNTETDLSKELSISNNNQELLLLMLLALAYN